MNKESLIISMIIGDGYIAKESGTNTHYLSIQHSPKQKEFLDFKKNLAVGAGFSVREYFFQKTDTRLYPAYRINIKSSDECFKTLKHKFYPNGNKTITRQLLNKIDALGLAIWWMDDGCLSVYNRKNRKSTARYGKLCTHGFSYEENIIIQNYLKVVWRIETTIKTEKNKYFYIHLGASSLNILFSHIKHFIIPSMEYKTDMKYK